MPSVQQPDESALPGRREDRVSSPEVPGEVDPAAAASTAASHAADEDEVARLRANVAHLEGRLASADAAGASTAGADGRRGKWRPLVAGVFMVIAALLAPLAIVATWAHDEITDTDRYVATVSPLASDPAVQNVVIARITDELFSRIDVQAVTQEAVDALAAQGLPPRVAANLDALTIPIANGVRSFVTERVTDVVQSPQFARAWDAANRAAHARLVAVLTGRGDGSIDVTNGQVTLNLGETISNVKAQLEDNGFSLASRIPTVDAQLTLFESAKLAKARDAVGVLERVARVLPVLALLFLAAAVYVARDRRRALVHAGLAVALSMIALGAALNAFRPIYLNAIPDAHLTQDAAGAIYDRLVHFVRLNLRAVLVVALAVSVGAWLSGPSSAAVAVRRWLTGALQTVRGRGERAGVTAGPVGVFVYQYRTVLRAVVIGLAVLVYAQAAHPTGGWTLKVLAVAVVALLLLELVARPPGDRSEAGDGPRLPSGPHPV